MISRSRAYLLASLSLMLPSLPVLAQDAGGVAANQEIRIQQMEGQIRGLTGQVEELSYQVRTLTDQINRLVADTDFRLRELEGGAGDTGASAESAPTGSEGAPPAGQLVGAPPPPPAETYSSQPLSEGSEGSPPAPVGQPRVLGTMSQTEFESQKSRLNAADPAAAAAAAGRAGETATIPGGQAAALPGATPDEQYQNAFGLLRRTEYDEAEEALRSFIDRYPDHPLTGNANYWLGETYYVRADYNNAAITFAEGFQRYPNSGKAPDNLLKLGMSLAALGETDDACKAFSELDARYPNANDNVKQRAAKERQKNGC